MATTERAEGAVPAGEALRAFLRRRATELGGALLVAAAAALAAALATYRAADPSFNAAGGGEAANLLGYPGAVAADQLLQWLGLAAALPATLAFAWGARLILHRAAGRFVARLVAIPFVMVAVAAAAAALPLSAPWPAHIGPGGAAGELALRWLAGLETPLQGRTLVIATLLALPALAAAAWCHGATARHGRAVFRRLWAAFAFVGRAAFALGGRGAAAGGRAAGAGIGAAARARRARRPSGERREPVLAPPAPFRGAADFDEDAGQGAYEDDAYGEDAGANADTGPALGRESGPDGPAPAEASARARRAAPARPGRRGRAARQESLELAPAGEYRRPALDLLARPPEVRRGRPSGDALQANARMLESVLQDFGVKGEIVKIRTGPVVTLYELEPAPGTKSARVIGLADDIARSMSAVSARVAVVPGRNAIGIELPNAARETVYLREVLESDAWARSGAKLPIALGHDIGGAPVTVDLARMPHLLIAGTTGSGKSVAVNTMILSLLYRLPPDRCRLIMVDPKMLELSIYDGVPHLLSPVVTDPKKAVVALKWTVREMESRYRAMSKLGVRNIDGYNARLAEAREKGEVLKRRAQTGFDAETGKPVFEDEPLDLSPLPYVVVVIDEVADLMLVAGKDIEGAVQRLAQMARAAGIHVIMATQRPSVDVITGTIKANFPTRISFQVTSKIDSRTILGEQGAEQLLGQGDMLHMAGGGRITRVHGPFVSDEEVEDVVLHLRAQGEPEYDDSITEEDEVGDPLAPYGLGAGEPEGDGDDLYDRAVAIVARERKASTSFIQRHLKIGYNRAAAIIDRMEGEGVVSAANHVGKREVLVGDRSAD